MPFDLLEVRPRHGVGIVYPEVGQVVVRHVLGGASWSHGAGILEHRFVGRGQSAGGDEEGIAVSELGVARRGRIEVGVIVVVGGGGGGGGFGGGADVAGAGGGVDHPQRRRPARWRRGDEDGETAARRRPRTDDHRRGGGGGGGADARWW